MVHHDRASRSAVQVSGFVQGTTAWQDHPRRAAWKRLALGWVGASLFGLCHAPAFSPRDFAAVAEVLAALSNAVQARLSSEFDASP